MIRIDRLTVDGIERKTPANVLIFRNLIFWAIKVRISLICVCTNNKTTCPAQVLVHIFHIKL